MQNGWLGGSVKARKPVSRSPGTRVAPNTISSRSATSASSTRMSRCNCCWVGRVGPARRDPFGNALECQLPQAKLGAYDHPVTEIFVHPHPERLAVKLRERAGVQTVDYCLFKAADHSPSLPLRDRARALIVRTQRTMRLGRAVRGRCGRLLTPSLRSGGPMEWCNV